MRPRDIWIAAILGALTPAIPALAEVAIEPGISGQRGAWGSDGNFTVDGHCFGNVASIPTDGVMSVFSGNATFKNGSLFSKGSLNQSSTSFPDGFMVSDGSTQMASITPAGVVYLRGKCLNSSGCSNTIWEPAKWNDGDFIQDCNNCYNYGNDTRTDNWAQPGYATGHLYTDNTVDAVKAAALSDGLRWVGKDFPGNTYDCGTGHLIFMAVNPGYDYHWWRLDQTNARWSHKLAAAAARNTDELGQPITNPVTSVRFGYTDIGGFFCNCGGKANIKGWQCSGSPPSPLAVAALPADDGQAVFTVELDAFSGRRNPVFELSPIEAQGLLLPLAGNCARTPGGSLQAYPSTFLGYRGLTVFRSAPGAARTPSVRLSRGTLRVFAGNPPDACRQKVSTNVDQYLSDVGQATEKYLVDVAHAKGIITNREYEVILKGMQGKW